MHLGKRLKGQMTLWLGKTFMVQFVPTTDFKKHKKRKIRRNQSSIKNNVITQTFGPLYQYVMEHLEILLLSQHSVSIKPMTFIVQNILK